MEFLNTLSPYFPLYIVVFSGYMSLIAAVEIFLPLKVFTIWHKWVMCRYFRYYGCIAVLAGFPLTQFRSGFFGYSMLFIGGFIVFSGPVIFLYPEKFRELFPKQGETFSSEEKTHLVWADAVLRILTAAVCLLAVKTQGVFPF